MSSGDRVRTASRLGWLAASAALGAAAFWVAALALRSYDSWFDRNRREFGISFEGWIGWLALYALAGFLAALALRPPRALRYRPLRPILATVVPILLIAHGMAWFAGWSMPGVLRFVRFYASTSFQTVLAVFVGFALASGFDRDGPRRGEEREAATVEPPSKAAARPPVMSSRP